MLLVNLYNFSTTQLAENQKKTSKDAWESVERIGVFDPRTFCMR